MCKEAYIDRQAGYKRDELVMTTPVFLIVSHIGLEIEVAMVANATMFSHLLPGCSCGSKHLLLP